MFIDSCIVLTYCTRKKVHGCHQNSGRKEMDFAFALSFELQSDVDVNWIDNS